MFVVDITKHWNLNIKKELKLFATRNFSPWLLYVQSIAANITEESSDIQFPLPLNINFMKGGISNYNDVEHTDLKKKGQIKFGEFSHRYCRRWQQRSRRLPQRETQWLAKPNTLRKWNSSSAEKYSMAPIKTATCVFQASLQGSSSASTSSNSQPLNSSYNLSFNLVANLCRSCALLILALS